MRNQAIASAITTVVLALVAVGCGSSKGELSASSSENTFLLSEFTIVPPKRHDQARRVTITASNVGGEMHELVIVRASEAKALPRERGRFR